MPNKRSTDADPTFEEALTKLESIVENLEEGDIPLADLVANYEAGTKLLRLCQEKLDLAEQKIEQLKQDGDALTLEPFEA